MSGSRRGRRHGWEREGWKERQEREKKERKRDRDGREKDRGAGEREREIRRETGVGERERERERDRGEREKITNTKKIMQVYLVVLYSAERSEARQWIVARQVSCYNPLSLFNPVTRDKVGKKMIERQTGWERKRKI